MILKMYAVRKRMGKEISRKEIGIARMSKDERLISARKYNELHKTLEKAYKRQHNEVIKMVTEEGAVASFCGYPSENPVRFTEVDN